MDVNGLPHIHTKTHALTLELGLKLTASSIEQHKSVGVERRGNLNPLEGLQNSAKFAQNA